MNCELCGAPAVAVILTLPVCLAHQREVESDLKHFSEGETCREPNPVHR